MGVRHGLGHGQTTRRQLLSNKNRKNRRTLRYSKNRLARFVLRRPRFCMKITLLILLSFYSLSAYSEPQESKLPVLMHSFYATLQELRPYINSEEEFKNPKNRDKVKSLLKKLENKIDGNKVKDLSNAAVFDVTYELLGSHIRETNYLYEHEIYGAAHNNLKATTGLCIMCHERLPKPASLEYNTFIGKEKPVDNLSDAEFFYISHEFDQAITIYDSIVRKYDGTPNDFDFDQIYKRKIAFFARIQRNPKNAIANLKADAANLKLPTEVKQNLKDWIQYFETWNKEQKNDPAKLSDKKFLEYAKVETEKYTSGQKIHISDPYIINLLRLSGLLYENIFKKPNNAHAAEMLYLLAKCERDLSPIQKYNLSDIYLKKCVISYPKSGVARKCFNDYEISMKLKFKADSEYIKSHIEGLRLLIQ